MLAALLALTLSADPAADSNNSFDFDLMAPTTATAQPLPAVDPHLQEQVEKRRFMLHTHQILGLTTLALMATTVTIGQLNYNDMYTHAGEHSGEYIVAKRALAYVTAGSFFGTGAFSIFAPTPYEKSDQGIDTATLHKAAVGMATVGMVSQIVLGFITGRYADAGNGQYLQPLAKAHQIIGYSTLGFMSTAALVWLF